MVALAWLVACPAPSDGCAPGEADYCQCDDGFPGAHVCDANGAWSACACDIPDDPDDSADEDLPGASTYTSRCAPCHGSSGGGTGDGPALTAAVPRMTDDEIVAIIRNGRGRMPAFTSLSDEQVTDVVAFLRVEFGD